MQSFYGSGKANDDLIYSSFGDSWTRPTRPTVHKPSDKSAPIIRIREQQLQVFAENRVSTFKDKLARDLSAKLSAVGRAVSSEEAVQLVEQGVAAGLRVGLIRECDLAQYVLTVALYFDGRWNDPLPGPAGIIMASDAQPPEHRLALLCQWAADNLADKGI
jgi:hypothetical protein